MKQIEGYFPFFVHRTVCGGRLFESLCQVDSPMYPQRMFWMSDKENSLKLSNVLLLWSCASVITAIDSRN